MASIFPAPLIAKSLKGSGEVVIYDGAGAWGEAMRSAYFEPFEAETGIKVIVEPTTDTGAVRASVMTGAPRYDIYIFSGGYANSFARDGLLEKIDFSFFERSDLDAFRPAKPTDYSCPTIIYSLLMAYNPAAFPNGGPQTWADMWDVSKFPGGRALGPGSWGGEAGTFEIALLADGVTPDGLYPIDFDRAFRSLDKIKASIVKFWESGAEGPQLVVDKQVAIAAAWNGRVSAVKDQGGEIAMSWHQALLQYDEFGILKGASNVENASKFIAFASRAKNQADFSNKILYAPPNSNAYQYLSKERAGMLPTVPDLLALQIVQNQAYWAALRDDGKDNTQYAAELWENWITR
ncbi:MULTISPECIES: ABC transporter substrate-binding protein [unclassified Mesorhizobium]|uniref:ABC transporter substrate-binding protein n=2 Tax=Mesorhizobium TaxID=68287 RepID=UPI001678929C|nr:MULTISPECIES: ABC transporter substrate-binding protein [unclassified Mesorhizobium]